jgi:hypothetical protein
MTTIRDYQEDTLGLLQQILATLQAQPNPVPTLLTISQQLAGIGSALAELLASVQRVEQFIAPAVQPVPTGYEVGMAHDLYRLRLAVAGATPDNDPDNRIWDILNNLWDNSGVELLAVQRIRDALWPVGVAAPVDTLGGPNNIFYYLYRLAHATTAPYNDPTPRQPIQVALGGLLDAAGEINEDTTWLVGAVGGRVNNLSAIDWLARIAECSCAGGGTPPVDPQGCTNPIPSVAVVAQGGRNYARWGSNILFQLGVIESAVGSGYPDGVALVAADWSLLNVFVASARAAYYTINEDRPDQLPTNVWANIASLPYEEPLAISVPDGADIVVYFCSATAVEPDPPADFYRLQSGYGPLYNNEGDYEFSSYAIGTWYELEDEFNVVLPQRVTNSESNWRHEIGMGTYVDLSQAWTFYADRPVSVFQGGLGFAFTAAANQHYALGPGTNWSIATRDGAFSIYIRPGSPTPS